MSNYNSENSKVLETFVDGDNRRMLLLHERGDGSFEYVIGSCFEKTPYEGLFGYARWDYSWYWGNYFEDVVSAVEYWKDEVIGKGR